jgi:hypothetical protein
MEFILLVFKGRYNLFILVVALGNVIKLRISM